MYRMPACRAATTFTVRTVSISDDRKFQCIRAVIILLSPIYCLPLFLLLSRAKERYTMTYYVYVAALNGPLFATSRLDEFVHNGSTRALYPRL